MTLTYNPNLAKVKVDPHTKNQGRRSNGSAVRGRTDKRTDGQTDRRTDTTKYIISLASRSIITSTLSDGYIQPMHATVIKAQFITPHYMYIMIGAFSNGSGLAYITTCMQAVIVIVFGAFMDLSLGWYEGYACNSDQIPIYNSLLYNDRGFPEWQWLSLHFC